MSDPRPLPLWAWTETHRQARRRFVSRLRYGALTGFFTGILLSLSLFPHRPLLLWNASASMPVGLYHAMPGTIPRRGDIVIARLPDDMRDLAARRHYLPANVPLVKQVAGVPGDWICAREEAITLNGQLLARRLVRDSAGRLLPGWHGCFHLGPDGYFLLAQHRQSFDGRYFGASARRDIIGRAQLLWAR